VLMEWNVREGREQGGAGLWGRFLCCLGLMLLQSVDLS